MKIALGLEYDGAGFRGWQTQRDARTVQSCLEAALSRVAARPIGVHCAGRTDAGVHAYQQVAHFETLAERSPRAWALGTNANLPPDISVIWAIPVPDDFHARYTATARSYRYVICNRTTRTALWARKVTWDCRAIAVEPMAHAAEYLCGTHDFSSFRAAGCQAQHAVRTVIALTVTRADEYILFDIEANAFLQHMVRNIVGTLLEIGRSERPPSWALEVLSAQDRTLAGATAPADGLYFLGARYPAHFGLPAPKATDVLPLG